MKGGNTYADFGATLVLVALLILCDAPGASAQDPGRIKAEVRVGGASPVGELDDFLAGGPSLFLGGRYLLDDRFALLLEGGSELLPGRSAPRSSP